MSASAGLRLVACAAVVLVGCGDPQERAISGLGDYGYTFTVSDYLQAAADGNLEAVSLFHRSGMAVDAPDVAGNTALMRAVAGGHWELVRALIASGADVQHAGSQGETVLMAAARGGDFETVKYLLERGADPSVRDDEGWSPLTVAAYDGSVALVGLLAPKARRYLDDALYLAAVQGSAEVTDTLLKFGASVFARSKENRTALMYAAENGHLEVVQLLMKHGANRFAMNEDDQTAAEIARLSNAHEVAAFLEEPLLELEIDGDEAPGATGFDGVVMGPDGVATPLVAFAGTGDEGGSLLRASAAKETDPAFRVGTVLPRIAGAVIRAGGGAEASPSDGGDVLESSVVMHDYREAQLPVMLAEVRPEETAARVRMLAGRVGAPVDVAVGEEIEGTGLRVVSVERKLIHSKAGKGELVDVSEMIVEEVAGGVRHRVVKDLPARSSRTYALMSAGGGMYDVRVGDEFEVGGAVSGRYRVVDVRPTQVVIENTGTGGALTVNRQ